MSWRARRTQVVGKALTSHPLKIELLSVECQECEALEQQMTRILTELGLTAEIIKTGDRTAFAWYSLRDLPAVAINGKLVFQGRAPTDVELHDVLKSFGGGQR